MCLRKCLRHQTVAVNAVNNVYLLRGTLLPGDIVVHSAAGRAYL